MTSFIPGIELSRFFYFEVVRPLLGRDFPTLPHAAALLGDGSEKLGFDTPMSTDHDWGPSVLIFLRDQDAHLAAPIRDILGRNLPHTFYGYPVSYVESAVEPGKGILHPDPSAEGSVNHLVTPLTLRDFIRQQLGYSVDQLLQPADWLTFSSQHLLSITAGAVYYDDVGELTAMRQKLAWYPHDVWLLLMGAGWQRISEEEHLMPRAGFVGDEIGSALIGSRLVRDVMRLCFLMERRYAPYPKWFGSAFKRLACASYLSPVLWRAQTAQNWQEREDALTEAYQYLARAHNALNVTGKLHETVSDFFGRPFRVISAGKFAEALVASITDPEVTRMASRPLVGNVDQLSDNTDLLENTEWRPLLRDFYSG